MAKEFTQNVIGIEINEEYIIMSQINEKDESYILTQSKQINMPPRAIIDGLIADPETIADQISTSIEDGNFDATNIVIALNSNNFLKKTTISNHTPPAETQLKVENLCQPSPLLQNKEYQVSFQKFSPKKKQTEEKNKSEDDEKEEIKDKDIILYAALHTELIDNLEDLAKSLDMNLVSIDLIPLGTLRALQWQIKPKKETNLLIAFDYNFIDINFTYKNNTLLARTLRNNIETLEEEELRLDAYITTIKQLFLEFSNKYPEFPLPKNATYHSRNIKPDILLNQISKDLNITFTEHDIKQTITLKNQELTEEKISKINNLFLPSIGLALKYYEPVNKTLSLTKVKKQLAPIFKKETLIKSGFIFSVIIGGILATNAYMTTQINSIETKLSLTKNQINIIQSGNKKGQKAQLGSLRKTIEYYEEIRSQKDSKYLFFYNLISILPNDITFTSLTFNDSKQVSLKGSAFFQDSIYTFFSELEKRYNEVTLSKITTKKEQKKTINVFTINFTWSRK